MTGPRETGPASELEEGADRCTCCDRKLKGKVAWLEYDQRAEAYHDRGDVPPEKSQGWFPFGMTCARKLLAEEKSAKRR